MRERLVARRGGQYLVQVGEDRGRILDMEQRQYFPELPLNSLLARGYWVPYTAPDHTLSTLKRDILAAG